MTDDKTPVPPDHAPDGAGRRALDEEAGDAPRGATARAASEGDLAQAARMFWAALLQALGRGGRNLGRATSSGIGKGGRRLGSLSSRAARGAAATVGRLRPAPGPASDGTREDAPAEDRTKRPSLAARAAQGWRDASARRRARLDERKLRPAATVRATRWIWRSVFGLTFLALLGLVVAGGILVWAVRDLPLADMLPPLEEPTLTVQDEAGDTLFTRGAYRAGYVALDEMPEHLPAAVSAIEDRRFWDHPGVDIEGIGRALWRNIASGGVVEGGSTITQQLVKVLYLDPDRTYKRKLQEMVLALGLERQLGKDRIMELYLNSTYLGAGAWGMPAAAQLYFDTPVQELSLAQSAILAATIRAPSVINPEADLERARERGLVVLSVMRDLGRIDAAAYEAAQAEMARLEPSPPPARAGSYFADWVLSEAQELAGAVDGPLTVTATLDKELQAEAEAILERALAGPGAEANATQGAIVAMTADGRVRAMVGGVDYDSSQFNRATDALRQPGSTFKLPVFLTALVMGADPETRLPDEPIDIDGYAPENFNGRYAGMVTLREAFARSLNAATVRLGQEVGIEQVIEVARQLGIEGDLTPTPSLALGTSEVSLLDMTEAYAAILAGRAPIKATGIASLKLGETGVALSVSGSDPNAVELNRTREPMLSMLRSVVTEGTGSRAAIDGFAAGKTGTSQNSRDAWFIGFTDRLVVGVWIGNDDNSPMDELTGGSLPAEIWRDVVRAAGGAGAAGAPSTASQTPVQIRRGTQVTTTNADRLRQTTASSEPQCDVRACSRAYRSFRASDCTFQPYSGPRRLCTR